MRHCSVQFPSQSANRRSLLRSDGRCTLSFPHRNSGILGLSWWRRGISPPAAREDPLRKIIHLLEIANDGSRVTTSSLRTILAGNRATRVGRMEQDSEPEGCSTRHAQSITLPYLGGRVTADIECTCWRHEPRWIHPILPDRSSPDLARLSSCVLG